MMSASNSWHPSASITNLLKRAEIVAQIRHFFTERGLLEVETPALAHAGVTDPHMHPFITNFSTLGSTVENTLYLMTSPEYHMKRLLAAGSGPIFQICKSFRNGDQGGMHNPEFTILEWYRPGYSMYRLMDEVDDLMQQIMGCEAADRLSYQKIFLHYLELDPLTAGLDQLRELSAQFGPSAALLQCEDRDILLQFLFNAAVEPQIGANRPALIYHFPASQAALAQISHEDSRVAERFELYYRGVELANGFHELSDPQEQEQRFLRDNRKRQLNELPPQLIDEHFLAALRAGLPDCSGVALGVDRLLMLALSAQQIREVISFDTSVA